MVLIPNLRGIYYWWTSIFNPGQLPLHNLDIMRLPRFRALFQGLPLEQLHCSYFGTFSFWLFTAPPEARWINRLIRLLLLAQRGLNLMFSAGTNFAAHLLAVAVFALPLEDGFLDRF